MIIVVIIFVFFLGVAVGLGLHFPLSRELRKAFDVAAERMHAANARVATMESTLRKVEGALQRSRNRLNNGFSEGNLG
jgi:hypothetical protein